MLDTALIIPFAAEAGMSNEVALGLIALMLAIWKFGEKLYDMHIDKNEEKEKESKKTTRKKAPTDCQLTKDRAKMLDRALDSWKPNVEDIMERFDELDGKVDEIAKVLNTTCPAHLDRLTMENATLRSKVDDLQEKRIEDKAELYERVISLQDLFATRIERGLDVRSTTADPEHDELDGDEEYDDDCEVEDGNDDGEA